MAKKRKNDNQNKTNDLIFNALTQGLSWNQIQEIKDEMNRSDKQRQPTQKDILTNWIIMKDQMLQQQGNSYDVGGGGLNFQNNGLTSNYKGLYSAQQQVSSSSGTNSSTGNISIGESANNGSNVIDTASQIGGFIEMFDQLGGNIYQGASQEFANFSDDPYKKAIVGDSSKGMLAGLVSRKSELNNTLNDINNQVQQFNIGDNASLMSQWNTQTPLKESTGDAELVDILGTLVAPGMYNLFASAQENQKAINQAVRNTNARNLANFSTAATNTSLLQSLNQRQNMAKCGGKLSSHRFAEGGLLNTFDFGLTEVNAGGSHEENPNEGVIVSYAQDGLPNKVEEGETIHNDYVYSKRLKANKKVLNSNLLDEKYEGKPFADISKELSKNRKERPNDPISKRTQDENLQRLQGAQEELKIDNETKQVKRFLGSLNDAQLDALQQQMMDEYEAYAEQMAQQEEQEAQQYQEEQAVQEGLFGRGGHLKQGRGNSYIIF